MIKYLYVMAHSFSGSTLASFLLGAHPEIATVGELGIAPGVDVEKFRCSCGELLAECGFWARVSEEMKRRGLDFDIRNADLRFRSSDDEWTDRLLRAGPQNRALEVIRALGIRLWPKADAELHRLLGRYESFVRTVTEIRGRPAFVDISKRPGQLIHLRRISGLELKTIRLLRDPRAVAYSCMKNLGVTLEEGARSWVRFQVESSRMLRFFPRQSIATVRYETLCRDPGRTLAQIHSFLGVTPSSEIPDFRAVEHHIIGNRMRLSSGSEIRLDETWRRELSPEQVETVNKIAGPARVEIASSGD